MVKILAYILCRLHITMLCCVLCIGALSGFVVAQPLSNSRFKHIIASSDSIVMDTLSIVPQSLKIFAPRQGIFLPDTLYTVDNAAAVVVLQQAYTSNALVRGDSIIVQYRVFNEYFLRHHYNKIANAQNLDKYGFSGYTYTPTIVADEDFFSTGGISKSGSIARGITFGNNQDVVLNSSLNLQLAGKLNSTWEVNAAITDNNIPIQPEGNTQQLQDFDRVFIQLKGSGTKIIAGDFDLAKPKSYFLSAIKRGQGLYATNTSTPTVRHSSSLTTTGAVAISRGKYARNVLQGIEGNQGPYRLTGNQNELFIIILAGTERIYADGRLLSRGTTGDYIIDYNTGELSFTQRMLITRDVRIVAEYQYSDRNFVRTLAFAASEWKINKWAWRVNFMNEQDSKNQPLLQTLDDTAKTILALVGNNTQLAFVPQIDSVGYNTNEVLYALIDTIVNSIQYKNILRYSSSPDSAFYRAVFSFVGNNKGNYIQIVSAVNGRIYVWVPPANGVAQGSYEPITQLVAPTRRQQTTLAADYKANKYVTINWEGAVTNNDVNLFSKIGNTNNTGLASMLNCQVAIPHDTANGKGYTVVLNTYWEYVQKQFVPMEFYRNVEFVRDWNVTNNNISATENIMAATAGIRKNAYTFFNYTFKALLRDTVYNGYMHSINTAARIKKISLLSNSSFLNTITNTENTRFIRGLHTASQAFNWFDCGIKSEHEENLLRKQFSDSLLPSAYRFMLLTAFVNSTTDKKWSYNVQLSNRWDDKSDTVKLIKYSQAQMANTIITFKSKQQRISATSQYRYLKYISAALSTNNETTVLNRLDYFVTILKGGLTFSTSYQTGNGRELRKEFVYVETAPGQGNYTWIDYNNNGIKEFNEFEIAQFADQARYIKVLLPTNTYIKAFTNGITTVVGINADQLISSEKKIWSYAKKISAQLAFKNDNKITANINSRGYNPFYMSLADTALIVNNQSLRNVVSINKASSVWDADYVYTRTQAKNILNTGYDIRTSETHSINTRINFSPSITYVNKAQKGTDNNLSEYFFQRNFTILSYLMSNNISYQWQGTVNVSLEYIYSDKQNYSQLHERAKQQSFTLEGRIAGLRKINVSAKWSFINIKYNGESNNAIAYQMLEGLRPGNNNTWNISIQQNLSKTLQITIGYEGRKSEGVKTVHLGNMSARAYF